MRPLWEVADFFRAVRRRMRFGEFSRAPLQILRVEARGKALECDWMIRPPDHWDWDLSRAERGQNESMQALADAMAVRNLVFEEFPKVHCAVLRAFRQPAREPPEVVILGTVPREIPSINRISSLVMRAKLQGFCFSVEDGCLKPLQIGDRNEQFIT